MESECTWRFGFTALTKSQIYNIASRAVQSNSVYVSVLKIPIVHADSVSKLLRRIFFFFSAQAIVSAGKKYYISRQ